MPPKPILVAVWRQRSTATHLARPIGERVALLGQALAAVQRATASERIPRGQSLRAILVVPEYYFARENAGRWRGQDFTARSLSQEDKDDILRDLARLSRQHPSILFVPGTIAWKKPLARAPHERVKPGSSTLRAPSRAVDIAPVLERRAEIDDAVLLPPKISPALRQLMIDAGKGDDVDKSFVVRPFLETTALPSTAMFQTDAPSDKLARLERGDYDSMMRNTAYLFFNGKLRFKYHKQGDYHEAVGDAGTVFVPGSRVGTCEVAGLRLGLEICLDHELGSLARHVDAYSTAEATWPHLHIVTSDSTDNDATSYRVRDGGYFVHASTDDDSTIVSERRGAGFRAVTGLPDDRLPQVGRAPIGLWTIQL